MSHSILKQKSDEQLSNVVFVGPGGSGKTTSLILLHHTCLDYRDEMKMVYDPVIRTAGFNLYRDADNLLLQGIPPPPTMPALKDTKVELNLEFGGMLNKKRVRLVFADMAGQISGAVMRVFPELSKMTPEEVVKTLEEAGLNEEDVDYLVRSLLSARGVILVADASKIGQSDTPDADLAYYLDNLNQFVKSHGSSPKGIALLLTKFDKWKIQMPNPTEEKLHEMARNYLPHLDNFATNMNRTQKTQYRIFYSMLREAKDKEGNQRFAVEIDNKRHQRRLDYTVDQYQSLIYWLKNTFGS